MVYCIALRTDVLKYIEQEIFNASQLPLCIFIDMWKSFITYKVVDLLIASYLGPKIEDISVRMLHSYIEPY